MGYRTRTQSAPGCTFTKPNNSGVCGTAASAAATAEAGFGLWRAPYDDEAARQALGWHHELHARYLLRGQKY